jgi:hypothetical protein
MAPISRPSAGGAGQALVPEQCAEKGTVPVFGRCRPGGRVSGPALALGLGLVGALSWGLAPGAAAAEPWEGADGAGPVVLIGTTGLSWEDVSPAATPAIWGRLEDGAGAAGLLNRSVRVGACPVEGWLAVGAGSRIGEVAPGVLSDLKGVDGSGCRELAEPVRGAIPAWEDLTEAARAAGTVDQIGRLAAWLAEADISASAIGPGAALALADGAGQVEAAYQSAPASVSGLRAAVSQALADGAGLLVVDVGSRAKTMGPDQLDARIGAAVEAAEAAAGAAGSARIVVASLADWANPALGVALDWRPGQPGSDSAGPRLVESNATKTAGLALVTDLTQVLEASLAPAPIGPVDPWRAGPALPDAAQVGARLADLDRHAVMARRWGPAAWTVTMVVAAFGLFGPMVNAARRPGRRAARRGQALIRASALAAGAFPAAGLAANAAPWWRAGLPLLAWAAIAALIALGVAVVTAAVQRHWPGAGRASPLFAPAIIGLASAGVVMADPFVGRIFTRDAPLGYSTLLAGRLYGYSNTLFAVLVTGALLACALLAAPAWAKGKRLGAAMPIGAVGLIVLLLDANPNWGADLGGAVGIVGAFVVMAVLAADVRVNWKWVTAAAAAGLAAAGAAAWLDYLRGPGRWTHLGGFVETLTTGGLGEVLARKGLTWLRLSVGPAAGLAVGLLLCVYLGRRGAFDALRTKTWTGAALLRPTVAGLVTAWALGSLVNDSGLVVAVTGLAVAGPLLSAGLGDPPRLLRNKSSRYRHLKSGRR